jgi:hypothetical protein
MALQADAATQTMKWDHVGVINASWAKTGLLADYDELRDRWLGNGEPGPVIYD